MARPLPVNLLLAGSGAVLMVSGIGGQSIRNVLKGTFGELKVNPAAGSSNASFGGQGQAVNTGLSTTEQGLPPAPTSLSTATFAPSPTTYKRRQPTKQQEAQGIAAILFNEGIRNPTAAQITAARKKYEKETGITQFIQIPTIQAPELGF